MKIISTQRLTAKTKLFLLDAPEIAAKHQPGQFIILRVDENGERIPLTIADSDPENGTLTIICQEVGATSAQLCMLEAGDSILDLAGPLGRATHIATGDTSVCIAGGYGVATINPILKALRGRVKTSAAILGARSGELLFWADQIRSVSDRLYLTTNDGSVGEKGMVTDSLKQMIDAGGAISAVYAVGPIPMMEAVYKVAAAANITTYVSLNSIMVDGTGMCGSCRVTVAGEVKFVCVDGPEFDASLIDFEEISRRNTIYHEHEKKVCCMCKGE